MISVNVYRDKDDNIAGFGCVGHAGYADPGADIVCAAVSMLVINTINSIEKFTADDIKVSADPENGDIQCMFPSGISDETRLLFESMLLGLEEAQKNYGEYIKVVR